MFGICVLPSELPASSRDPGVTEEIVCDLIGEMNVKSVRVWMHIPYVLERADSTNEIRLITSRVKLFHDYFAALKEAGVQNIVAMSHQYLYPVECGRVSYNGVIPDPAAEAAAYRAFLEMFRKCYSMMAEEFPEVTLWEPNSEPDRPGGSTVVKEGYRSGTENDAYLYTQEEVARITADLCYYANLGIKSADTDNLLVMPGLSFGYGSGTYFIETLYEQIASGRLPTGVSADTDPDSYFDILNWHPYAGSMPGSAWLQENIAYYNIAEEYGDGGKPLFFTEFGWTDENDGGLRENIAEWYPAALDLLQEDLPALEAVFCFRMFNWTGASLDETAAERNHGIFTSPQEDEGIVPKPAALALFSYFNGADADPAALYKYQTDTPAPDPDPPAAEADRSNMFGICVLPSDLPASSRDPGVTEEIVCDLIGEMNIKSVRVWMHLPYVLERVGGTDTLRLKTSTAEEYHSYFAALKAAGVENILVMNHRYIYPAEYSGVTYEGVVPDPETEAAAYRAFLEMFRDCYQMLAEEFPEVTLWEPNNETDHPSGTTIVRNGYRSGSDNSAYLYSMEEVARITADLCYYANLGIKSVNTENRLVMPGLVFGYDRAVYFIETLYEQIASGRLPTGVSADTDPDSYFDILNWHPYANVAPGGAWLQENIAYYNIAEEYGDGDKPVFLSEFGWSDEFSPSLQENIAQWYPEALNALLENLPTLEAVFCFRMFNWVEAPSGVKDREKSFGIFTSPQEEGGIVPKPAALALFSYFNGADADTSGLYKYRTDSAAASAAAAYAEIFSRCEYMQPKYPAA